MKVAKDKVNEYGTTVRPVVERTADNLRLGTNLLVLRDLSCLMRVPMFSPFKMQSAAAPFYPLASAM